MCLVTDQPKLLFTKPMEYLCVTSKGSEAAFRWEAV